MIRRAREADTAAIRDLLDRAFHPSDYESRVRELVAASGEGYAEWVFDDDGQIIGHVLYSEATDGAEVVGFHLGPVAVLPELQRRGIAAASLRRRGGAALGRLRIDPDG